MGVRADDVVAALGDDLGRRLTELTGVLVTDMTERIPAIGEAADLHPLLDASVESNLETVSLALRGRLDLDDIGAPPGAVEYARRLAQRGTSPNALARAYRLGHQRILDWGLATIPTLTPDAEVRAAAARRLVDIAFRYIDAVSEQVLVEYQSERERWLALRNTAQAAVIDDLLGGRAVEPRHADATLGYRLGQHHLGAVLWSDQEPDLTALEQIVGRLARAVGAVGAPLYWSSDRSTGWLWFGLGRTASTVAEAALERVLDAVPAPVHVAIGTAAPGATGFRDSHREALAAQRVALTAGGAPRVTSYANQEVRAAAMLTADLDQTRRWVATALGGLAAADEAAERLRETLLVFLQTGGSYLAAAQRLHLHKNTVKYRVDKALAARGRPVGEERLDVELALVACRWLGAAVLGG